MKELKTYDEWNNDGFYVNKGSKAIDWHDNKPLFSDEQVTKKTRNYVSYDYEPQRDYDLVPDSLKEKYGEYRAYEIYHNVGTGQIARPYVYKPEPPHRCNDPCCDVCTASGDN